MRSQEERIARRVIREAEFAARVERQKEKAADLLLTLFGEKAHDPDVLRVLLLEAYEKDKKAREREFTARILLFGEREKGEEIPRDVLVEALKLLLPSPPSRPSAPSGGEEK